jgi:single-stranded DNA-binding protein
LQLQLTLADHQRGPSGWDNTPHSTPKTEKWEDRDGNKKQVTKVIGSKLPMLGDRNKPVLSEVEGKEGREPGDEDEASF